MITAIRFSRRLCRGAVAALLAVTLLVLVAAAAMTVDVGKVMMAAGRAQMVADCAAMAGGEHLPNEGAAVLAARKIIAEYSRSPIGTLETEIQVWGPGETLPDGRTLGPQAWALQVVAAVQTPLVFARAFGLEWARPVRRALVVYGPVARAPIVPIWIPDDDYVHGQPLDFFYSPVNGTDEWLPGNFGWLKSPAPDKVSFMELLRGEDLTTEQLQAATVSIGDVVEGLTGVRQGQTAAALRSRIQRASDPPYDQDTVDTFHRDNPRIMIIPLVTYLGGTGSGARFRVERFAAAWLNSLSFIGANSKMTVLFLDYEMDARPDIGAPGGGVYAWALDK